MYAAGILPISWVDGRALFLLGKDARDGSWSDFAGRAEPVDRDKAACAAREFWEETHGLIASDPRSMRARLTPQNSVLLLSRTQNNLPFYCYVVELPYLPWLRATFLKTVAFLRHRTSPRVYVEKTDVRYVTWEDLVGPGVPKRGVFRNTIEQHRQTLERIVAAGPTGWKASCVAFSGG